MNYLTVLFGFQMYGYILAGFELLFLNSLLTAYFQILGFFFQDFLSDPLCMWPIFFKKKYYMCVWKNVYLWDT